MFVEQTHTDPDHQHVIRLKAYHLWQERGSPLGSPEVDWFRAEEELTTLDNDTSTKPRIVTVAEAVGSAVGSIAGIVTSAIARIGSEEDAKSE